MTRSMHAKKMEQAIVLIRKAQDILFELADRVEGTPLGEALENVCHQLDLALDDEEDGLVALVNGSLGSPRLGTPPTV